MTQTQIEKTHIAKTHIAKIVKVKTGSKFEEIGSYSRLVSVDNWIYVSWLDS